MSVPEGVETVTEVESHGQRWGHQWTATATIYAEHDPESEPAAVTLVARTPCPLRAPPRGKMSV